MLEVAWTDWWLPGQLLGWLADLVRSDVPGVRQAAAGAIGWSAGRDVRAALETVGDLARERRAGVRQAAAIVLVAMAMQPGLRQRVRTELDQWAAGPAARLRDTVARAYGLGLARLWPDAALMQLRLVAQARMQRRNNSVVRGLVEVYRDGHAATLVPELVDWTGSDDPEVRLHAARTLRVLADRWAEPPREHWPELLDSRPAADRRAGRRRRAVGRGTGHAADGLPIVADARLLAEPGGRRPRGRGPLPGPAPARDRRSAAAAPPPRPPDPHRLAAHHAAQRPARRRTRTHRRGPVMTTHPTGPPTTGASVPTQPERRRWWHAFLPPAEPVPLPASGAPVPGTVTFRHDVPQPILVPAGETPSTSGCTPSTPGPRRT